MTLFTIDTPEPPALGTPLDPRGWYVLQRYELGQGWAVDLVDPHSGTTPDDETTGDISLWLTSTGAVVSTARHSTAGDRLRKTYASFMRRLNTWRQFNHGPIPEAKLRQLLRECRLYPIERRSSAEEA